MKNGWTGLYDEAEPQRECGDWQGGDVALGIEECPKTNPISDRSLPTCPPEKEEGEGQGFASCAKKELAAS